MVHIDVGMRKFNLNNRSKVMAGVNKVILVGNVGADPDVRTFDDGNKLATLSIATSESWTDKKTNEKKEKTEWHNIVFRGGLAGVVESYVKKGSQIYVEGKIQTRSYEKDGVTRYVTEVVAQQMNMLGSKNGGGSSAPASKATASASEYMDKPAASAPAPSAEPVTPGFNETDDDLPF